jgi:drug/metabolite transporter (DMT)-like permease
MAFTAARFALGALVVAPLAWQEVRINARAPINPRATAGMLGLGALMFAGAGMQQMGLMTTTVTNAGFLTALYVPLVPIFSWIIFRRQPHLVVWPAAMICMLGTWLLAGGSSVDFVIGDLWFIGSALPWALHVALVGVLADRWDAPYRVACTQFAVCSVLAAMAAGWWESTTWQQISSAAWAIAYTGVVSVGLGFTAQVVAQRHTRASDAALILSSEMLFAAFFGALLMGDTLSGTGWLGGLLIVVAIASAQLIPLWWRPYGADRMGPCQRSVKA